MIPVRRLLPVLVVVLSGTCPAQDQQVSTNFTFARPSDLTITVSVMGFVQRPGRYEIATTIDLLNLLALAGGPTSEGTLGDVRIMRALSGRDVQETATRVLDLTDAGHLAPEELALEPGDVVVVGRSSWSVLRDVFGIVVTVAIVTTAVSNVIIASE